MPKPKFFDEAALLLGIACVLIALGILFLIPVDVMYDNGRRMKLGDIYRGLEALFGEHMARFLSASPFFALGYMFFRKAYPVRSNKR
jgi:hypothetical protein